MVREFIAIWYWSSINNYMVSCSCSYLLFMMIIIICLQLFGFAHSSLILITIDSNPLWTIIASSNLQIIHIVSSKQIYLTHICDPNRYYCPTQQTWKYQLWRVTPSTPNLNCGFSTVREFRAKPRVQEIVDNYNDVWKTYFL